jgi:hypothetical protein
LRQLQHLTGDIMLRTFFGDTLCAKLLNGKALSIELADIMEEMGVLTGTNPWTILHNFFLKRPAQEICLTGLLIREKKSCYRE